MLGAVAQLSVAAQAVRAASIRGQEPSAAITFDRNVIAAVERAAAAGANVQVDPMIVIPTRPGIFPVMMTEPLHALSTGEVVTDRELHDPAAVEAERAKAEATAAAALAAKLAAEATAAAKAAQTDLSEEAQAEAERALEAERVAAAELQEAQTKVAQLPLELDGPPVPPYTDDMIAAAEANQLPIPPFLRGYDHEYTTSMTVYMPTQVSTLWPHDDYKENGRIRNRWYDYREFLEKQVATLPQTYRMGLETLRLSMGAAENLDWLPSLCGAARSWYIRGGSRRELLGRQGGAALLTWIQWMGWDRLPEMIQRSVDSHEQRAADMAETKAVVGAIAIATATAVGGALIGSLVTSGIAATQEEAEEMVVEEAAEKAADQLLSEETRDTLDELRRDKAMDDKYLQNVSLTAPTSLITRILNWLFRRT